MDTNVLFLAEVMTVYPKRIILKQDLNSTIQAQVQHEAYTIDVKPAAGRLPIQGVRVISPSSGTNAQNGSGFIWMPAIGDWVVCGYLEGYPDHAVCLGAIKHPYYDTLSSEGQGYEDCIFHHQSNSWIRIRDLEKYSNPSSTKRRSEINLHHSTGAEIKMTEPSTGKCEIEITHPTGATIQITSDGTVNITAKKINLGAAPEFSMVLGETLKTYLEAHTHFGNLGYPTGIPIQPFNNYLSTTTKVQK